MASLPPKPIDSSPKELEEHRYSPDHRDRPSARPMASQGRYRSERLSENDRFYTPRHRQSSNEYDSYAPSYDGRRDDDLRRNRDRDRDWRGRDSRDRDRGSRTWESGDYDRDRRGYERDRVYDRRPVDERYRSPDSSRRDSRSWQSRRKESSYRPSRSPPRRRSPSPAYRGRPLSRPHSRSPPPKRLKLGNHSIATSPQPRSPQLPSQDRCSPPKSKQLDKQIRDERTPPPAPDPRRSTNSRTSDEIKQEKTASPCTLVIKNEELTSTALSLPDASPVKEDDTQMCLTSRTPSPKLTPKLSPNRSQTPVLIKYEPTEGNPTIPLAEEPSREVKQEIKEKTEPEKAANSDVKVQASPSPPRYPRLRGGPPQHGVLLHRRTSRSPPRGPRNHLKNAVTPTGPASFHPTGPRSLRRQLPPSTLPATASVPQSTSPSASIENPPASTPEQGTRVPFPIIPRHQPQPSLTSELDTEIARLQSHRAHLASEHIQIAKNTRRALHELDTAAIDLRAAELRRKVADTQMEKARAGVLGIDAVPADV